MTDWVLRNVWPMLVSVSVKSLFVLALAALSALCLRRASAAARHFAWTLGIFGLLLLSLLSLLPLHATWQVPLWPQAALTPRDAPVIVPAPEEPPPTPPQSRGRGRKDAAGALAPFPGREGAGRLRPGIGSSPTPPELGAGGRSSSWPLRLCALWLLGVLLTALPSVLGLFAVARLARQSRAIPDGPLTTLLAALSHDLSVTPPIRLLQGDMTTPMTWGWLRPVILLPVGADEWPEDRLRAVLLHELAHIARADWPAQMAAHLACALYWWNPGVWLAARQARIESERACDDRVLLAGVSASDYARHLLDIARSLTNKSLGIAVPMAQTSQVEGRLRAILQSQRRQTMTRKTLTVASLATFAILVPLAALRPAAKAQAQAAPLPSPGTEAAGLVTPAVPDTDGVTVQLVGVADGKSAPGDRTWWNAAGNALPAPLPRVVGGTSTVATPVQERVIAFRVTSPGNAPVSLEFQPAGALYSSSAGSWVSKMTSGPERTESQIDAQTAGYRVLSCGYTAGAKQADIRVGIGDGPWATANTDDNITDGAAHMGSDMTYLFTPVTPTDGGSVVTISLGRKGDQPVDGSQDLRVVALDAQGVERLPTSIGDNSSGSVDQIQARFALPPAAIKSIRVETRPYHWVTFHNVPLNPVNG